MNKNNILVFDFETDSADCTTTNPIQISSLVVEPRSLKIVKNSEFDTFVKPDGFSEAYVKDNQDVAKTFKWHADNHHMTLDLFIKKIEDAVPEKVAWANWMQYWKKWHTRKSNQNMFSAPILSGYNITSFDLPIFNRLCEKYGNVDAKGRQNLHMESFSVDIMKFMWLFFEDSTAVPNIKMDTMRRVFSLSMDNAHDGLKDCRDEADVLIRTIKLIRQFTKLVPALNEKV